jgi:DNA repair exonuclease SbcCD ATPase subunit
LLCESFFAEEEMRNKQDMLESGLVDLKSLCAGLEERLKCAEAQTEVFMQILVFLEVMSFLRFLLVDWEFYYLLIHWIGTYLQALLLAHKKDIEALQASEREQANLHQSIEKLNKELIASAQQVGVLQDVNKRLQEYNTSLQQYNTKLQSEASSAAEAISRTQKEKVAIMENLSTLRGHSTTLSSQLDSAKASLQEKLSQNKLLMDDTDRLRVELQRISEDRDQRVTQVLCFASAFPYANACCQ